jgi:uncharacterized repeat protein (TIGR01451 family)
MSGTYSVTVKANSTCTESATGTVYISVGTPPLVLSGGSPICAGGVLAMAGNVSGNYTWAGPNGFTSNVSNPSINASTVGMSGVYSATVIVPAPCAGTSTATISVTVQTCTTPTGANITLQKTVSNSSPNTGDNIIYSIKVINSGPQIATNVVLKDLLPAGLTFVSVNMGTYVPATGLWTIGTVPVGTTTVTMTVTVN